MVEQLPLKQTVAGSNPAGRTKESLHMLNIVIFGSPGAGKGTQAEVLAARYGLRHLSSGDILRRELKNGPLGREIKSYQDAGKLVPDKLIIAMMEKAMARSLKGKGLVLDGYPRNMSQAKKLDSFLKKQGTSLNAVLNLQLPQAEAIKRLLLRSQTSGRSDDNPKTIKARLKIYQEQTKPILEYYKAGKRLINIDGRPAIKEIERNIRTIINKLNK